MQALSVFIRGCAGLAILVLTATAAVGAAGRDRSAGQGPAALQRGDYDGAITAARDVTARPGAPGEANLLLGRALLERHRASRTAEDLASARTALGAVDASALSDRGRAGPGGRAGRGAVPGRPVPIRRGVARAGAGADGPAAGRGSRAGGRLVGNGHGPLRADPAAGRAGQRLRRHLVAPPPAPGSLSRLLGGLVLAAGRGAGPWRSRPRVGPRRVRVGAITLAPDRGVSLRADLDRLVTQAIIPERVKRLVDEPDGAAAAARFASEWDEAKGRWKR